MADKKISELNSASLPLAGTEVIPIVQGGETKKVAVSGLTPSLQDVTDVGNTTTNSIVVQSIDEFTEVFPASFNLVNQTTNKSTSFNTETIQNSNDDSGFSCNLLFRTRTQNTDFYFEDEGGTKSIATREWVNETKPNAIGDIYNKNTWANTSDFTTFGDATVSLSGSYINIGSATNGSFNNYIKFSRVTNLNKYRMVIEFKVINAPSSTTFGLGLGLRSANSISANVFQYIARIGLPSSSTFKRIYIDTGGTTYTNRVTSGTDATFALNDIIRLTVEQDVNVVTCNFLNLTTGNTQVSTYTFPATVAPFLPNTGNFVIHMFGGTYEMRKLVVESKDYENAKLICVGDSKTVGYFADSFTSSFGNQLVNYSKGISINAGGSDKTAEVLLKIPELIALKPKRVLLNIGSNDKRFGISYATWQANYDSIVSQLEAEGIEVYHLLQLNESSLTFTDYNSHITSTYDSSKIIDAGVVSLNADGIHPNQQAMNHIFYTILSKIKLD